MTSAPDVVRGEILRTPTAEETAYTNVGRFLAWLATERSQHLSDYSELWQWSVDDLSGFWSAVWDYFEVIAHDPPSAVLSDRTMPGARWFPGATVNYAEHALRGDADQVVVTARSQTRGPRALTRAELREQVARVRAGLQRLGVGRGDRVAGYLPNIPETVIALLATTSLGAIWVGCAPEFGTRTVLDRFQQVEPTVLIAVDGYRYGVKDIDRADALRTIVEGLPGLRATVVIDYLASSRSSASSPSFVAAPPHLTWADLVAESGPLEYAAVPFDHPLWILFSSGTTGLPKAITHSHGGILLESLKSMALQSDLGPGDRYFVYATTTWVMWNILVSTLLVGASIVLMDGNPNHPDGSELWRIAAEESATSFGCGASLIVESARRGLRPRETFDLSSLRALASTGSPLPADAFRWVYNAVGEEIYLQSSSGGTDVCGSFVGGSPMLPVRAGEIACRSLGVDVAALDPDGNAVINEPGELVVSSPMPSMPVSFWNDPDGSRYREAYFEQYPGRWRHGDWIVFNEDGSCRILGRSDGTLNRGGVRLGSAEFYAVLDTFPQIWDSLVVHLEDPSGGLGRLTVFVQLAQGAELDEELRGEVVRKLRTSLSPRHTPDEITAVPAIPYGLTGKKLEIPVKRILQGSPRADVVADGAVRDIAAFAPFEQLARQREQTR